MLLTEDEALQGNTNPQRFETVSAAREDAATVIREKPSSLPSRQFPQACPRTDPRYICWAYFLSSKNPNPPPAAWSTSHPKQIVSAWIREALVRLGSRNAAARICPERNPEKDNWEAGQANVVGGRKFL